MITRANILFALRRLAYELIRPKICHPVISHAGFSSQALEIAAFFFSFHRPIYCGCRSTPFGIRVRTSRCTMGYIENFHPYVLHSFAGNPVSRGARGSCLLLLSRISDVESH